MSKEYIAGFFDGEGMVRLNKTIIENAVYYSLQTIIVNTDIRPLIKFQEMYGGTVASRKKYKENHKVAYRWRLTTNNAEKFLQDILPYTIIKQDQIKVALEFQKHIKSIKKRYGGRYSKTPIEEIEKREIYFMKLQELKKQVH